MDTKISINNIGLQVRHVVTNPKRPTLVFLHDSLGCIRLWRDFPEQLAAATGCNYLIYDRGGYGLSDACDFSERKQGYMAVQADVLQQLLDKLAIKDSILFGHSDGGTIALLAAAKYPEMIRGVVAEAAHVFVEEVTLTGIRAAVEQWNSTNLEARLRKYHGENTVPIFNAWTKTWLSADYRNWNIESYLPQITCPTLVIQGTGDEYGTMKQVEAIVNQIQGRAYVSLPEGIGHSPHKESTALIMEQSVAFVKRIL